MSVSDQARIDAAVEDLSPYARIRLAALTLFSERGVDRTSVRAVAEEAGVSPGLVQHYFPSKSALRDAVDRYVLEVGAAAFSELPREGASSTDRVEAISHRVTALFRDRIRGQRYVARGLIDHDDRAIAAFDATFETIKDLIEEDIRDGRARPDLDVTWAVLQIVVYHLGVVLLEHGINRHLPDPVRSEAGLERWRRNSVDFYRRALYHAS
jgi:AcrR family transcriptional regulator